MDRLSRIICEELNLRIYTVETLDIVKDITGIHETTPNATFALGRTISATALLSATLKPDSDQNITLRFSGNGPLKEIHVQADARGNIRGYLSDPLVDITESIGSINFSKTIGAGILTVIKDIGSGKPFKSLTPLVTGEIAQNVAYYLTTSEQIPSAVMIGMNIDKEGKVISSGGILIQTYPNTESSAIDIVERNLRSMPHSLGDAMYKDNDIYSFVSDLLNNTALNIIDTAGIRHSCRCSREILKSVISGFQKDELENMIKEDKGLDITCNFCKKLYNFSEGELADIISGK